MWVSAGAASVDAPKSSSFQDRQVCVPAPAGCSDGTFRNFSSVKAAVVRRGSFTTTSHFDGVILKCTVSAIKVTVPMHVVGIFCTFTQPNK